MVNRFIAAMASGSSPEVANSALGSDVASSRLGGSTHDGTLAVIEDGASVALRMQSNWMRLAVDATDPNIAASIAFFGLGSIALPFMAGLRESGCSHESIFSYSAHASQGLHLFTERELKERFGLVDIAFKMKELALSPEALETHMRESSSQTLKREVRDIRRWKESVAAALKMLQRRAALSYLGLNVDASEADINKVYKKLALELHPDKGGDPEKFQTLQTMRERTLDAEKATPDAEGNDGDKDDIIDDKTDLKVKRWEVHRSMLQLWDEVKQTRNEIKPASAAKQNSQEALSALQAFVVSFLTNEMVAPTPDNGTFPSDGANLGSLAKMGAEIIAVSSVLDPEATHSILAAHVGGFLVAHGCSVEQRKMYIAVLRATKDVNIRVDHMLTVLEPGIVTNSKPIAVGTKVWYKPQSYPKTPIFMTVVEKQNNDGTYCLRGKSKAKPENVFMENPESSGHIAEAECGQGTPSANGTFRESQVSKSAFIASEDAGPSCSEEIQKSATRLTLEEAIKAEEARILGLESSLLEASLVAATSSAQQVVSARPSVSDLQAFAIPEDENVLTFAPPPFQLGPYQMVLRLIDRGTWEEVQADLTEGAEHLGTLRGTYILRGGGAFLDACCGGACEQDSPISSLFDEHGRPAACWCNRVSERSCGGGLVIIENVRSEDPAMQRVVPDFIQAVLQCLAGPMKRVTLAVLIDAGPSHGMVALRSVCSGIGFQHALQGQDLQFMEVGQQQKKKSRGAAKRKRQDHENTSQNNENVAPMQANVPPMEPSLKQPKLAASPFVSSIICDCSLVPQGSWDKLTPRARYALAAAAAAGASALQADAGRFTSGKAGGHYWGCECFPTRLKWNVFKAFVMGFANIVGIISTLLQCERAPTVAAVSQFLSPFKGSQQGEEELQLDINRHFVSHFFGVGGTVESVLTAVIKEGANFYDACESNNGTEFFLFAEGHHALPIHMLDGDFEFVRSVLIPDTN